MGTLSGNGGGSSPEGGGDPFDGLPDLPPEWGVVVVPDDPGELAQEAAEVRRELRRESRRSSWQRLLGVVGPTGDEPGPPSVRMPIMIMMVAVFAALTSMFAIGWQREAGDPRPSDTTQRTAAATATELRSLPALELVDGRGDNVSLRSLVPAVILLTDGCECGDLIQATAAATPTSVRVVTVVRSSSPPDAVATGVRSLGDPTGGLRRALGLAADRRPAALLVDKSGGVVRTVGGVEDVESFRTDLPLLTA